MIRYLAECLILSGSLLFILWIIKTFVSDWHDVNVQMKANKYKQALKLIASASSELGPGIATQALEE